MKPLDNSVYDEVIAANVAERMALDKVLAVLEMADVLEEKYNAYEAACSKYTMSILSGFESGEINACWGEVDAARGELHGASWMLAFYNSKRDKDHENLA